MAGSLHYQECILGTVEKAYGLCDRLMAVVDTQTLLDNEDGDDGTSVIGNQLIVLRMHFR
jgi:hypothetical protein